VVMSPDSPPLPKRRNPITQVSRCMSKLGPEGARLYSSAVSHPGHREPTCEPFACALMTSFQLNRLGCASAADGP
jgi:hypothetical protein